MSVLPYSPGDAKQLFDLVNVTHSEWEASCRMLEESPLDLSVYARTLFVNDRALACFGIMPTAYASVAHVWSLLGGEALRHPVALYRGVRQTLDAFEQQFGLRRMVSVGRVDERFEIVDTWHKELGFRRETREPGMIYFDGVGTCHQYARVKVDG